MTFIRDKRRDSTDVDDPTLPPPLHGETDEDIVFCADCGNDLDEGEIRFCYQCKIDRAIAAAEKREERRRESNR